MILEVDEMITCKAAKASRRDPYCHMIAGIDILIERMVLK
jgi:hypothetical protein